MSRANWMQISPDGTKALSGLHHFVTSGTNLPAQLIHLVFLRVSQINGCAYCIDLHSRDLIKQGMTVDKVLLVPVWHEAEYLFSDLERVALAWAEEVRWTPLSRPKNGDPSLLSHQRPVVLAPR